MEPGVRAEEACILDLSSTAAERTSSFRAQHGNAAMNVWVAEKDWERVDQWRSEGRLRNDFM